MILRRCCVQDSEQALIDVTRGVSGFPDMEVRIFKLPKLQTLENLKVIVRIRTESSNFVAMSDHL